ncbi:MAG: glycosyl transferase family 51 [Actinoallomurus sp.]|jgi:membrane peptidoglycan carboxypeptidase|nr:glycosyl transferase family 51 [Actinoallomurus sp.]
MSDKPANDGDANAPGDDNDPRRIPDENGTAPPEDVHDDADHDTGEPAEETPADESVTSDSEPADSDEPPAPDEDEPAADERATATEPPEPRDTDDTDASPAASDAERHDETVSADATKPYIIPPADQEPEDKPLEDEPKAATPGVRLASAAGKGAPDGKRPKKQTDRRIKYARRAAYVLGVLVLIPVIGFVIVYLMTPIPSSTQPTAKAQQSVFYYNDGKTVIARTGSFDRRPVDLATVPPQVRDAVISAENRSFYSDPGVSMKGSARAVWATLTGGSMQGGSTITQQMVRNYYSGLSQQRTAGRKLKEIMIALKVSREKNKDWILQQYLNTIYFGRDAYGIEAAAQAYYNTDVQKLTPAQGAYLAAAIQVPSYAGDLSVPGAQGYMQARWQYVVNGMAQMGSITPQQAATMRFPQPSKQKAKSIFAGDKGYMVSQAKAELRRMGYTDNQINMGGLKVKTTFDKDLMAAARQAVQNTMPSSTPKKVLAGLVSINPDNGEINAFYGGKDYIDQQFNNAFDAKVQAGSGFKPYVLAAALIDGESLNTYVDGSSPQMFAGTALHNDQNENFGMVNLVTATQDSINTAYVNLGQKVGLGKVVSTAEKAGIPAAQLDPHKDAATLPLGVADVSVEQQAAGYATFAAEGTYHAPHVIKSVDDHNGKPRQVTVAGKRAFSPTVAHDATYAMQKVVDAGTGVNAGLPDRNAAGKTGTTSDGKQLWFNGFIPQLAASVGIFRSDNKPLAIPGYTAYGGDLPARIWRSYMVQADKALDLPPKSFAAPSVYTGGGGGRSTTAPVNPRPRPSGSRPAPPPTIPTHPIPPPTDPPTGPPTLPPPTGAPQRGVQRNNANYPDLYG